MLGEEMGTIRETFFNSQLGTAHELRLPENGDFLVDEVETGAFNKIPLWLSGFLY
jgi:hypothetical protein